MAEPAGVATLAPASRRGRPRRITTDSGLEPREEILREAARLFSGRGVAATRLTDIAAAVGITAPTIYYHFENHDAIVGTLLAYVVDESAAFATAAARRSGPCSDRLESLVTHHVERLTSGPYDLWFVVGMSADESGRFRSVARKAAEWRRAVGRLVSEGIERGEFRPVDVTLALAAVSGLVYAALQLRHQLGSVDAAEVGRLAVASFRP
jgi:AcrR family transcriptional regulator